MTEAQAVRNAVQDSQRHNMISIELFHLVHAIAKRRMSSKLFEDVAQSALLKLQNALQSIRIDEAYQFVTTIILNDWKHVVRSRNAERKYLLFEMRRQIDMLPPHQRRDAAAIAFGSFLTKLKYY